MTKQIPRISLFPFSRSGSADGYGKVQRRCHTHDAGIFEQGLLEEGWIWFYPLIHGVDSDNVLLLEAEVSLLNEAKLVVDGQRAYDQHDGNRELDSDEDISEDTRLLGSDFEPAFDNLDGMERRDVKSRVTPWGQSD